jgi:hypothetical protein
VGAFIIAVAASERSASPGSMRGAVIETSLDRGRIAKPDAKILALFWDWANALRSWGKLESEAGGKPTLEQKAAVEEAWSAVIAMEDKISDTPAAGPVGLAVRT